MPAVQVKNDVVDIDVPTDEDAKQCARLLRDAHPPELKSVDLRRGVVTSAGAGIIAKGLKGNTSLKHLGLPGNSIGDVGVIAIGRSIELSPGCALASIDLSSTGMSVVALAKLVTGIASLQGLHTICLGDNNLAQEAGHQLAQLFKTSASLHTLLVEGNFLGDRGVAALCGAFCYLSPTRTISLDVSRNGIGDLGMQWLCKGISALCRSQKSSHAFPLDDSSGGIRDLRLSGNNITHSGAKDLAQLLSEERCARELRELDLSLNTITADGFRPLTVSLRGCAELTRLDVAGCRLGPGGVEAAAEFIAAAGPNLRVVNLTPKAEFADRVLGDRGGLAVALRQSLQRLADSLRFAGTVVEVGLGPFLRADPASAASIEETLREHRAHAIAVTAAAATAAAAATSTTGSVTEDAGEGSERGGGGGEKGGRGKEKRDASATGKTPSSSSRSGEKLARGNSFSKTATPSRARSKPDAGSTPSSTAGKRNNTAGTPRSGGANGTPNRTTPARARDGRHGVRSTGIERPKAGVERTKVGTAERVRRPAGSGGGGGGGGTRASAVGGAAVATPPPGPSASLHRSTNKASARGGNTGTAASGRASSKSAANAASSATPATLAARDTEAAAVPAAPHKRMHQGEELDSIDGFSPVVAHHAPSFTAGEDNHAVRLSARRLAVHSSLHHAAGRHGPVSDIILSERDGGGSDAANVNNTMAVDDSTLGSDSEGETGAERATGKKAIADVVSKVMGDTEGMADQQDLLPSVAPSTWQWQQRGGGGGGGPGTGEPASTVEGGRTPDMSAVEEAGDGAAESTGKDPEVSVVAAVAARLSKKKLSRKGSSCSMASSEHGDPELASGMAALTISDERRPGANSRSHETALEISSGMGGQQLVTVDEAGKMLAPLVAQEVEKEAKKIEIRMQNEMQAALRTVRSEMEAIDREGLMARVAMEKRLKSGIKRLLDRIDHLERRFSRFEREDRKRVAALEAGSAGDGGRSTAMLTASAAGVPTRRRALPASSMSSMTAVESDDDGITGGSSSAAMLMPGGRGTKRGERVMPGSSAKNAAAAAAAAEANATADPESRPLVVREAWSGGAESSTGGASTAALSSTVASEEDFDDSGDESEADIVRMLEEKMAALEGKLLGHEERQRADPRVGDGMLGAGGDDDMFGQGSAVWA